jgi:hypothetical protein
MELITPETENTIRGHGHYKMRGVSINLRPFVCSFEETQIHNFMGRPNGSGVALPEVPRDGGTFGTRSDAPDDHSIDSLSPCCRLAYRMGRYEAIHELAGKMKAQIEGTK